MVQEAIVSLPIKTKKPPIEAEIANFARFFKIRQNPLIALVQKFSEVSAI